MLKKKIYILLLFTLPLFAQKEGANWYFGSEAGLNFNSGSPVAVPNGALSTNEGCAAISTPNGVLQFYTDGITVYNSNHYPMPNGSDLMGHPSSTQSAIVIPAPMDFGRYYIFTVDYQAYPNGLRYTKVDMSLNGGLGDVVVSEKNIPLHTPVAEKISAVYHENLEDIWVISHGINNNEYLAYLVTSEGVTTTPVISAVGEVHTCSIVPGSTGTIGYLKFSPDGKKLACAISDENVGLELLDFDPATGAVSNSRKIYNAAAYGLEFSPAGNLLYFTKSNNLVPVEVMQCDITLPTLASIQASMTTISFENAGALQLGIDGKIYVANPATNHLGVIHNPNSQGVDCNFESAGVSLAGKTCNLGLPNFFQSFFLQAIRTEDICLGNSAAFLIKSPVEPTSAFWTFGDGETSNSISPQHNYSEAGTYTVTVDFTTAVQDGTITLIKEIKVFAVPEATEPADMLVCEQAFDGVAEFNLALQSQAILGQQSPADYSITYHTNQQLAENGEDAITTLFTNTQNPQTIYARVVGEGDCYSITSFDVIVGAIPVITNPEGLVACEEERGAGLGSFDLTEAIAQITGGNDDLVVTFYRTPEDIPAGLQITAPETYSNTTPYNQTVYFKVVNADTPECDVTGELALVLHPLPELNAAVVNYLLCDEQSNGDGYEVFDLSSHYNDITTESGLNLTYSYEQDNDMIIIDDPTAFQNTVAGGQVIYVSAQNVDGCESVTSFIIKIVPLPAVQDPGPFYACEEQPGLGNYDLLDIAIALTGSQANVFVSYYATFDQAQDGIGDSLPSPYYSGNTTIYARIGNTLTECVVIVPVALEVLPAPIATEPAPLNVCDPDNDDVTIFNLDPVLAQIEAQLGDVVTAVPFETYNDAFYNAVNNVITNTTAYTNVEAFTTGGMQTIYIRVGSDQTECFDIVELQLVVQPVPEAVKPQPYELCDNGGSDTDGIANFDLTTLEEEILGGIDPAQFPVTFFENEDAAIANTGVIETPASYNSPTAIIVAKVTNTVTGCYDIVDVELIVNPLPVANPPAPYTLCDLNAPGDEIEVFDLNTKIDEIIATPAGVQDGLIVTFFKDYDDAVAGTGISQILNPEVYSNAAAVETLFVRVTVEETGCYRIVLLDVRVEPVPVLVLPTQDKLTVCDTTSLGIGEFDLEELVEDMVNGAPNLEVTFHTTYQDALDNLNPITEDLANYHNVNPFLQYLYVRVENPVTECVRLEPYTIMLVVEPAPQAPEDLENLVQCDDRDNNGQDGRAYFDLTVQNEVIHTALGTDDSTLTIHYFTSENNANNGAPRITNPSNYYGTHDQTIWVRVETPDTECFSITSFQLELNQPLLLTTPTVLAICNEELVNGQNDGVAEFDLTVKDDEILGPQGIGQGMTVTYFEFDPRVDPTAAPIANPEAYINPAPPQGNPKTLYVMVTTPDGCKSYTTLTIKVLPLPVPDTTPDPLRQCDVNNSPDGMEIFNLTDAAADIRNGDAGMVLTYYETEENAHDRVNWINNITAYNSGSRTIWVRAEANTQNPSDPVCYQVVSFGIIVDMLPELGVAGVIEPYAICEQNTDGIATFDLNTHMDEILGEGVNPDDYTIKFFSSMTNVGLGIAMPYIYTNTSSPNQQNIFVQVKDNGTECTIVAPLTLLVEEAATAYPVTETFFDCDYDGTNDGVFTFDLTRADDDALGPQSPASYSVTYYTSAEDAEAGTNAIANPTAYRNTPDYQMIWVRVTNESTVSGCYEVTTMELFVERIPEPVLDTDHTTVCIDFEIGENVRAAIIDTHLDATHTFVWTNDGIVMAGETGPTFTVLEPGSYNVVATSATGCVSDPIAPVVIERSGPASPINYGYVVGDPFGEDQVITVLVQGYGEYQYKLDDGPWQNSNVFENVSAYSLHTIYVRDVATADPCNDLELILGLENVSVIDFPNFFTPNGDGYNDSWNIFGLNTDENRDAKIFIFDRYGKLMKQISAAGAGWDGTYNGTPAPATDYWFTVEFTIGGQKREFKAHFSLKR